MSNAHAKIRGKLELYAASRGIPLEDVRVYDVVNDAGGINPSLFKFISTLPRNAGQSEKNHNDYIGQIRSILGRLLTAIIKNNISLPTGSLIEGDLPEFLKPILPLMPRSKAIVEGYGKGNSSGYSSSLIINANSILILVAMA